MHRKRRPDSVVFGWGRSARLQHALETYMFSTGFNSEMKSTYLSHLKFHAASRLAIGDRKVGKQGGVADDRRQRVAMLVC